MHVAVHEYLIAHSALSRKPLLDPAAAGFSTAKYDDDGGGGAAVGACCAR